MKKGKPEGRGRFFFYLIVGLLVVFIVEVSCSPRPIKIGFIGGLSGYYADLGIAGRNGLRLALEEANREGGIDGHPLQLLTNDDKQDPQEARRSYKALVAEGVIAVVGPMTSSMAMALVPETGGTTVPLISPTVSTPDLAGKDDAFLRVVAPSTQEAQSLAFLAVKEGYQRALVVFDSSNEAFSGTMARNFVHYYEAAWQEKNKSPSVTTLRYDHRHESAWQMVVEQVQKDRPQVILCVTTSLDTALLVQHIRKAGFSVPVLGTGWGMSLSLIENGGTAVEGMRFCVPFNPASTKPEWISFKSRYHEKYGITPDFAAYQGYLAGQVLIEALQKGSPHKIKETILTIREFQGPQGKIQFDPYGDPAAEIHIVEIKNGQFVTLE